MLSYIMTFSVGVLVGSMAMLYMAYVILREEKDDW